jgi:hypothetical protein
MATRKGRQARKVISRRQLKGRDLFESAVSNIGDLVWWDWAWAVSNEDDILAAGYEDTLRALLDAWEECVQQLRRIAGDDESSYGALTRALNTAFAIGEIVRGDLLADRSRFTRAVAASGGRTAKRVMWQTLAAELAEPLIKKDLSASRISELILPKLNGRVGKTALRHFIGQQKKIGTYDRKRQESR